MGFEIPSHCLPRDVDKESTLTSDLFALGSSLYELSTGQCPYEGQDEERIHCMFEREEFPSTGALPFGEIIMRCWQKKFSCAEEIPCYKNLRRCI